MLRKEGVLITGVIWILFVILGLKGFQYWYGGFVVFFWFFLGLLNYDHKTTLFLLVKKPLKFLTFYSPLLLFWIFIDQFGLYSHLWRYPLYNTFLEFLWVYFVLYSFAGLALLELFYFISSVYKEKLVFIKHKNTTLHKTIDLSDKILLITSFAAAIIIPILAVFEITPPFLALSIIIVLFLTWMIVDIIMLKFHIKHWLHYCIILITTTIITVVLNEIPNTIAREWVYLQAPLLHITVFEIPLWVILGWIWWCLLILRLWILIALHKKLK